MKRWRYYAAITGYRVTRAHYWLSRKLIALANQVAQAGERHKTAADALGRRHVEDYLADNRRKYMEQ